MSDTNATLNIDVEELLNADGPTQWELRHPDLKILLNRQCNEISSKILQTLLYHSNNQVKDAFLEFGENSEDGNPIVEGMRIILRYDSSKKCETKRKTFEIQILASLPSAAHPFISFGWSNDEFPNIMQESQSCQ